MNNYPAMKARRMKGCCSPSLSLQGRVQCKLFILVKSWLFGSTMTIWTGRQHFTARPSIGCFVDCGEIHVAQRLMVVYLQLFHTGWSCKGSCCWAAWLSLCPGSWRQQLGHICRTGVQIHICRMEAAFSTALCQRSADDVKVAPRCCFPPPGMWLWGTMLAQVTVLSHHASAELR